MLFTMNYLRKIKTNGLLQSTLWLILGILFFVFYDSMPLDITFFAGILLFIQGIGQVLLFIQKDERFIFSLFSLVHCISACFTGLWALNATMDANKSLYLILAFITLLHAIEDLIISYRLKILSYHRWFIAFLFTSLNIIISLVLIFSHNKVAIYTLTSCNMMLNGSVDIWLWMKLEKMAIVEMGI